VSQQHRTRRNSRRSRSPLLRNRIHDWKDAGGYVDDNGQATLEDNDIFGNAFSGVEVKTE
jgi:hypothetical protein